jgi:hypothetical protein
MNEYRISQIADVKLEQEPSVGGDGLIHITVRDEPPIVLCGAELQNLKVALDDFLKSDPNAK